MTKIEELVMCEVNALSYDLSDHTGYLDLPDMNCTNMNGAIKLFKAIDPRVQRIFAGDVIYHRDGEEWTSSYFPDRYNALHVRVNVEFDECCHEKKAPQPFVVGDKVRFKKDAGNSSGKQTVGTVVHANEESVCFLDKDGRPCDGMVYQVEMVRAAK